MFILSVTPPPTPTTYFIREQKLTLFFPKIFIELNSLKEEEKLFRTGRIF